MAKIFVVTVNFESTKETQMLSKTIRPAVVKTIVIDNNKINRGFARGVNLGIKKALAMGAEKILIVNPDIKISPKKVIELSKSNLHIASPVLKFKRSGEWVFDNGGKVNLILGRPTHLENAKPNGQIDYVSGACMMVDRLVFNRIGFFDEDFFMYFEDVDFCLRAKKEKLSVGVSEEVIVEHGIQEHKFSPKSNKSTYILESNRIFIDKWTPAIFKPIARAYLFFLSFAK